MAQPHQPTEGGDLELAALRPERWEPGQSGALKLAKPRLRFVSADVTQQGARLEARVVLRQGDAGTDCIGIATAPSGEERLRLLGCGICDAKHVGLVENLLHQPPLWAAVERDQCNRTTPDGYCSYCLHQ